MVVIKFKIGNPSSNLVLFEGDTYPLVIKQDTYSEDSTEKTGGIRQYVWGF